jgi:hypothetical protein
MTKFLAILRAGGQLCERDFRAELRASGMPTTIILTPDDFDRLEAYITYFGEEARKIGFSTPTERYMFLYGVKFISMLSDARGAKTLDLRTAP